MDNFLTREQIAEIVSGLTSRDIFQAMPGGTDVSKIKGAEVASDMFESGAERQGHGALALDRVKPQDAIFLAELLSEVLSSSGPKADSTEDSPASPDTGDSPQS